MFFKKAQVSYLLLSKEQPWLKDDSSPSVPFTPFYSPDQVVQQNFFLSSLAKLYCLSFRFSQLLQLHMVALVRPGWEGRVLSVRNMHSSFKGVLGLGFRIGLFFHILCVWVVVVAPLTAVNPLNRETGRATRKQTPHKTKFKMCSEKHATSKASVEVPPELITVVSGGEG